MVNTEADGELSLTGSRGKTRRAAIGQRRRRRRDVAGRQDGDDPLLLVETMTSMADASDTNASREINPRKPLPGIDHQTTISSSTLNYYSIANKNTSSTAAATAAAAVIFIPQTHPSSKHILTLLLKILKRLLNDFLNLLMNVIFASTL